MSILLPDGVSRADLNALIEDKYGGSTENRAAVAADIRRLGTGEPLAYVIGWMPFSGLRIHLDSKPLIPRPETEWWTEELIRAMRDAYGGRPFSFLDLCAGSGAVGCAVLASFPNAQVSFGEAVPEHASTIRKNIEENGLDAARAKILIGDLFEPFGGERFDAIAANPPYIPRGRALEESVSRYERPEALYAGEDGLDLIRRIAREAPEHLATDGMLWVECDAEHAEEALRLVREGGRKDAAIRTDQYGRPRLIVG